MITLKASADFQRIAKQGRKWSGTAFIMQVLKSEDTNAPFRVGFTVSRRVGNAVQRNRAKRRLREMVRAQLKSKAPSGFEIVLIAKTAAISTDFTRMCAEFEKGLVTTGAL
jgi:ribonuclease P protein component